MQRFFYRQIVTNKKVVDGLGLDRWILLSQSPTQRLVAQGRMLDLLHQNRNRFELRGLPPLCAQGTAALALFAVHRPV